MVRHSCLINSTRVSVLFSCHPSRARWVYFLKKSFAFELLCETKITTGRGFVGGFWFLTGSQSMPKFSHVRPTTFINSWVYDSILNRFWVFAPFIIYNNEKLQSIGGVLRQVQRLGFWGLWWSALFRQFRHFEKSTPPSTAGKYPPQKLRTKAIGVIKSDMDRWLRGSEHQNY